MKLLGLDASEIPDLWSNLFPLLEPVLQKSSGSLSTDGIYTKLIRKEWLLWAFKDDKDQQCSAFVGAEIVTAPSGQKICEIKFMAGQNRKRWMPYIPLIEEWAVDNGCQKIQMIVPKQFAGDLPDYDWTHVFLERSLA